MNKKVVVFGGGTGLSTLLRGLKEFPLDLTAIVTVCDDGTSTGRLREEFGIPAIGDIRKVLLSLSDTDEIIKDALQYRFETTSDLNGHPVGNLLLTSLINMTGSVKESIDALGHLLHVKGNVLPLTEDRVTLVAEMENGKIIEGQHDISKSPDIIKKIYYKNDIEIPSFVTNAILEADYIILSMGSIYTSIIPNIISKDIIDAIDRSHSKILYTCNVMTQPGETDEYKASDHVTTLNSYLGEKKIEAVFVNTGVVKESLIQKYKTLEQKDLVEVDQEKLEQEVDTVIYNAYAYIEEGVIRHNVIKLGSDICNYIL